MPRNTVGGKKQRRGGNKHVNDADKKIKEKDETDQQIYGQITNVLGNGRVRCKCEDGKIRTCQIRGKMRKRKFQNGDFLLLSKRDFEREKENKNFADILYKYKPLEATIIIKNNSLDNIFSSDKIRKDDENDNLNLVFDNDDKTVKEQPSKTSNWLADIYASSSSDEEDYDDNEYDDIINKQNQ